MGDLLESMTRNSQAISGAITAIVFVGVAYLIVTLDRARTGSPNKDDTQLGIKLVLYGLMLAGVQLVAGGVDTLLGYGLGGFKGGSVHIKMALPPLLVGAGAVAVIYKVLLPRTNDATFKQPERYALGALGTIYGALALLGLTGVLNALFLSAPWAVTSSSLSSTLVHGAVAFFAVTQLGARSGWAAAAGAPRARR